jgi:hypothetical protein
VEERDKEPEMGKREGLRGGADWEGGGNDDNKIKRDDVKPKQVMTDDMKRVERKKKLKMRILN